MLQAVDLVKVSLLAINPVAETLTAFRNVSSAQEDRERIIVNAQRFMVSLAPQAHGNAAWEVEQADGEAYRKVTATAAEAEAIRTGQNAVDRLLDLYLSSSGVIISNKARDAFIGLGLEHEDLNEASRELLARIAPIARASYGVEVIRAGIVEYTLPVENRPSVIQRMIAERARIAARYRSEGEELAIRIEALALNEHEKLVAAAHAEATTILGKAEAEAMALLGKAYKEDPDFYKFIRALDSYDLIIDRNTTLMLPADNELFRYLDSKEIPE